MCTDYFEVFCGRADPREYELVVLVSYERPIPVGTRLFCADSPLAEVVVCVFVLDFKRVKDVRAVLAIQCEWVGIARFLSQEQGQQVHDPTLSAQPPRPIAVS